MSASSSIQDNRREREEVDASAQMIDLLTSGIIISDHQNLTSLPYIKDASSVSERDGLFIKKLEQCCTLFDYVTCPPTDLNSKEVKSEALTEMRDFIKVQNDISKCIYPAALRMISVNLFRTRQSSMCPLEPQDDPEVGPRKLIYEFVLSLLESPKLDPRFAELHFTKKFVRRFVQLFDSEDPSNRAYLRNTLQAIYTKLIRTRTCIRSHIVNMLYTFVYETDYDNGISEQLEILGSIIDDLPSPPTQNQKNFLVNVLMPLHKTDALERFISELAYCVLGFIEKEHALVLQVVKQLLRFWPKRNATKELLFIQQLGAITEVMEGIYLRQLREPVFRQLSLCMMSHNTEVSNRAWFYMNEYVIPWRDDMILQSPFPC